VPEPEVAQAAETEASVSAFGYLHGVRYRTPMLELRTKEGGSIAFSYSLLDRASFDPSHGVWLCFPGTEVRLTGRGLNDPVERDVRLYEWLLRHRVTWIQEASRADAMEDRNSTIGESILIV
jgi:hypothetical protein